MSTNNATTMQTQRQQKQQQHKKDKTNSTNNSMINLSKRISFFLRHDKQIGSLVDEKGFVSLSQLNMILTSQRQNGGGGVTEQQLIELINDQTMKQRFEYKYRLETDDDRTTMRQVFYIRALNGHSFPRKLNIFEPLQIEYDNNNDSEPKYIYHVTNHRTVAQILSQGLKPMSRQQVHLWEFIEQIKYDHKRDTVLQVGPINRSLSSGEDHQTEPLPPLFRSKNGYIMCPHVIPPCWIRPLVSKQQQNP